MSSSSLSIGLSALQAAQRGLELAGQNISNVNTPGYTRQRLEQAAQASTAVPSMFGRSTATGEGVAVLGTTRIQDQLLEVRALQTRGSASAATVVANGHSMVESAFGEPGDTGLQAGLSEFWSAWGDLATDPTSSAARTSVLEQGGRLASSFRELSGRLSTQWGGTREALNASVATANRLTSDVADLNDAIRAAKVAGGSTAELEDRRGQLVSQLGDVIGVVAQPMDDGTITLSVGGSVLVSGNHVSSLAVTGPGTGPGTGTVAVTFAASGTPLTVTGGEVGGMLTTLSDTIPSVLTRLDAVAAGVASTVNARQAAGYDATGALGGAFFSGTTAASLQLAGLTAAGVAASSAPPPASDGANADSMAASSELASGPDSLYRDLVVSVGVQVQGAGRRADVQTALAGQAESARLGVSSVSVDEEMVSLLGYQHAYEAAARFVSVVDETLNTLMEMAR